MLQLAAHLPDLAADEYLAPPYTVLLPHAP